MKYKKTLNCYTRYVTIKDSKYIKINSVNLLYLIFSNINGYFEEINGNKYLIPVSTNEGKEIIKKHEELWSKIRDLIRSVTKIPDDCDKKYMKIKFNSHGDLSLNKMIEISSMIIAVPALFDEDGKYYPEFFLDECLYKL